MPACRAASGAWSVAAAEANPSVLATVSLEGDLARLRLPVLVIHGTDDGLVPQAFSSAPYVAMAKSAGRDVRYWQVRNVQHFDAFLGFPQYGAFYLPLLPYVYNALDRVDAHLDGNGSLPADVERSHRRCVAVRRAAVGPVAVASAGAGVRAVRFADDQQDPADPKALTRVR